MITHYYADPHLFHANIIQKAGRPFASITEMHRELVGRYNSLVGSRDMVCWVGDVRFGGMQETARLLRRFMGQKMLVRGNHDPSVAKCLELGFSVVVEQMHVKIAGRKTLVCHYPPAKSTPDKRFPKRRPMLAPGEWLVHGHTHESGAGEGRRIHVGVDAWDYEPVSVRYIAKEMARRDAQAKRAG